MNRPTRPGLGGARPNQGPGPLAGLLRTIVAFALIAVVLWYFGFIHISAFDRKEPAKPAEGPQAAQAQGTAPPAGVEQTTTVSIHRQQLASAKVAQRQLLATFEATKQAIDEWEKELTGWEAEGPPLLKSDDGKRIAADSGQARRFRGIIRQTRPTSGELNAARQSAEDLAKPIREALNNPEDASTPDATLASTLQTLQTKAQEARDSYRQARDAVRAMLAQTKGTAAGVKTLEEAVAALDQEDAGERAAAIDAEEKKAKDAAARKIAEEKAQLVKVQADAEAARIRDEAAKKKQEADLAAARSIEEMRFRQKQADEQIAKLQDQAEQRRQGDLKTGSVWKGTYSVLNNSFNARMTVTSRTKDDIRISVEYSGALGNGSLAFSGTVKDNVLTLTPTRGDSPSSRYRLVYQPATKAISGGDTPLSGASERSLSVRLADDE
jgi:hypothetical protein